MGPVQGHQCPYDAPSVAEHFRKTGTVNLNPADVLLFRDSLDNEQGDELTTKHPKRRAFYSFHFDMTFGERGRCAT